MPGIKQPGLQLTAYWNLGESGWKPDMDANLRHLSGVVNAVLVRSDGVLPNPASELTMALGVNGHDIVGRLNGQWVTMFVPQAGALVWAADQGKQLRYDGTGWAVVPWTEEAPLDGSPYVRKDGAWVKEDYYISSFIPQITAASQQLAGFILPAAMTLPKLLTDCVARCQTASPETVVLVLKKNTTSIGTITFTASVTTGTIAITGTDDIEFAKFDELSLFAPTPITGVPEGIKVLFRLEM
jgi:hypothetical protein